MARGPFSRSPRQCHLLMSSRLMARCRKSGANGFRNMYLTASKRRTVTSHTICAGLQASGCVALFFKWCLWESCILHIGESRRMSSNHELMLKRTLRTPKTATLGNSKEKLKNGPKTPKMSQNDQKHQNSEKRPKNTKNSQKWPKNTKNHKNRKNVNFGGSGLVFLVSWYFDFLGFFPAVLAFLFGLFAMLVPFTAMIEVWLIKLDRYSVHEGNPSTGGVKRYIGIWN